MYCEKLKEQTHMEFVLYIWMLLHCFVAALTLSSFRLTSYMKVNDSALGMVTLGTAWTETSLLNCARACTELNATCHCFAYNETTGLCFPGSKVIPAYFDMPSTEVEMYATPDAVLCDRSSGFEIHALSNATVCLWVSTSEANFQTAEQSCKDKGANLVSLQTPEKLELVISYGMNGWIGLDDRDKENTFIWHSDHSVMTATQRASLFKPRQPNNARRMEDCVHFNPIPGGLNDAPCTKLALYMCEISIYPY